MPTIRDVAKKAGVAPSTVSLILNKRRSFSSEVESLVAKAVSELNYKPKNTGRPHKALESSTTRRTKKQIAFLQPQSQSNLEHSISYMKVLNGIENACRDIGQNLIIQTVTESHPLRAQTLINKIDGFIFLGEAGSKTFTQLLKHMPAVRVMGPTDTQVPWDQVTYNNALLGKLAADYLLSRGHKHCAYFSPSTDNPSNEATDTTFQRIPFYQINSERRDHFIATIEKAKGHVRVNQDLDPGNAVTAHLTAVLRDLLLTKPRPTGLFVPADIITMRVHTVIKSLGINLDTDLELVSANHDLPILETLMPQPVSVDIHTQAIGATAVSLLLQRISSPDHPRKTIILEPTLIA